MQTILAPAVTAVLAAEGLPAPIGATERSPSGARWTTRLTFAGAQHPLDLVRLRWNPGYDPFQNAMAAAHALVAEPLPTPSALRVLPRDALAVPAALLPSPAGVPSEAVPGERVFDGLATVLRELGEVYLPRFGLRADGGRFAPTRATWREEWSAFAENQYRLLCSTGLDLPVARNLIQAVRDGLHVLPESITPTLVHFGLRPQSLHFSDTGLASVGEWWQSFAGDPLAGWAPLLTRAHGPALKALLLAAGEAATAPLFAAEPLARIRVYTLTRALFELRNAAQSVVHDPSGRSATLWARAVGHAVRLLQPRALQRALAGDPVPVPPAPPNLRVGLLLTTASQLPVDRLPSVLAAHGACQLASELERAPTLLESFLASAAPPRSAILTAPIPDRTAWIDAIQGTLATQSGMALALWAVVRPQAEGAYFPDAALRGTQAWLAALDRSRPTHASRRLLDALLGWHAALELDLPSASWSEHLHDAADVLGIPLGPPETSTRSLLTELDRPLRFVGDPAVYIVAIVAALTGLEARQVLPADPQALLRATQGA